MASSALTPRSWSESNNTAVLRSSLEYMAPSVVAVTRALEGSVAEVDRAISHLQAGRIGSRAVLEALAHVTEVYACLKPYEQKELVRLILQKAEVDPHEFKLALYSEALSTMAEGPMSTGSSSQRSRSPIRLPEEGDYPNFAHHRGRCGTRIRKQTEALKRPSATESGPHATRDLSTSRSRLDEDVAAAPRARCRMAERRNRQCSHVSKGRGGVRLGRTTLTGWWYRRAGVGRQGRGGRAIFVLKRWIAIYFLHLAQ